MANLTTNYGWTKPVVGGDTDAWGGELNSDLDGIDSAVFAVSGVANAAQAAAMNDNRIMNGDMRIDQRNNGSSGTAINVTTIDRWAYGASQTGKGTWQRSSSGPVGFPYSWNFTSSSAYTLLAGDYFQLAQPIEADMVSDFAWGTASAQPVTLSFWASSSLTGLFGGAISNYAANRAYMFSFSLPTANVWTKIIVAIPGDTGGTWVMSGNGGAMNLRFDLGSGSTYRGPANAWANGNFSGPTGTVSVVATNGATFNVTGVKLELGSVATPFNRYSLAKCMADCQRYYEICANQVWSGAITSGNNYYSIARFKVNKRAAPTVTTTYSAASGFPASIPSASPIDTDTFQVGNAANATGPAGYYQYSWTASAEL